MTITDINKILSRLAENPTRENILDFSFGLLQWMNIVPNAGNKPQLLSPQTQKLKDFLAAAPQTVQPQLYRISADNQNIRVRFAVLKKLKKDYISQLVDNDPGLSSYQSFIKGLTSQNGTGFIPTQPYFIHFVTTPDYDKLVLIFNQGEQKRILSFRNRLTNTQYFKVVSQWAAIGKKSKPEIADLLWKSLDIKEVNKEFYKQVKESFDALVGILKSSVVNANENQIKQFAVRLIGRYIFCWFLKEKAIIPASLISSETIKATSEYYQGTLLRLFFDTLNTRVNERNWMLRVDEVTRNLFEKIPYLNGGLFDESEEDKLFRNLDLDNWLVPFVTVLENYDFTVDESSSTYQQIAVDPEMLGRIFENLLASQAPETEKMANERKALGAFYTPREIVDFMVKESIKRHLSEKLGITIDELSPAFTNNPTWPEKLNKRKQEAETILKEIKILDPACGSGAYPISVLHSLVSLREMVGFYPDTYILKKEILSHNIYGVDIMPMAIEIARLRAWLSLIVEEDYHSEKPKSNFGIDALPNLDFKFMQGNSLLETYEGLKLFDEKLLSNDKTLKENDILTITKNRIQDLQKQYLELSENKKLLGTKKLVLEKELKENNELLKKIINRKGTDAKGNLFAGENSAINIATKLKKLHEDYFGLSDKEEKKQLKGDIEELEWGLIEATLVENGKENKLIEVKHLKAHNIRPYFLYKLNFPEVYEKGGFDIVIGNPPYVRQESIKELKPLLQHYKVFTSSADLLVYFYELGYNQLNADGILTLITSNKFMRANYGQKLRSFLKENTAIKIIIDFGDLPVFEALAYPVVILTQKKKNSSNTLKAITIETEDELDTFTNVFNENAIKINQNDLDESSWRIERDENAQILNKLLKNSQALSEYVNENYFRGVTTGLNEAFIIDEATKNELIKADKKSKDLIKPFLRGKDIKRYCITVSNLFIIFTRRGLNIDEYPTIKKHLLKFKSQLEPGIIGGRKPGNYKWFEIQDNTAYWEEFEKPKIVMQGMMIEASYALDETGSYLNAPANFIASGDRYLLGLLNSKLLWWFLSNQTISIQQGYSRIYMYQIEKLPIRTTSDKTKKRIESLTVKIADLKKHGHSSSDLEKEIDVLVYKLYELTYDEVKIIDKDFWLSEEEYENYQTEKVTA
jgi:hypothetical protein